jgi:hypothetical protein
MGRACIILYYLSIAVQPFFGHWTLIVYTVGRNIQKGSTCTQNNTNAEERHTNIHASSWTRTHDQSVQASKDCSCLRSRGHCEWRLGNIEW